MDSNGITGYPHDGRPDKRQRMLDDLSGSLAIHPDLQITSAVALQNFASGQHNESRHPPAINQNEAAKKRASIACEVCRAKKTRCDGGKPKCRLCTELNSECIYREPGQKLDHGSRLILDQLNRIENLLHTSQTQTLQQGPIGGPHPAPSLKRPTGANLNSQNSNVYTTIFQDADKWPIVRDLLTFPYTTHSLLGDEISRRSIGETRAPSNVDFDIVRQAVTVYLDESDGLDGFVDRESWQALFDEAVLNCLGTGITSCLVLLIAAHGQLQLRSRRGILPMEAMVTADTCFLAAVSLMFELVTSIGVSSIQCTIAASAYLLNMMRPLEARNLLKIAQSHLQAYLSSVESLEAHALQLLRRLYWNANILEEDINRTIGDAQTAGSSMSDMAILTDVSEISTPSRPTLYLGVKHDLYRLTSQATGRAPCLPTDLVAIDVQLQAAWDFDWEVERWRQRLPEAMQFPQESMSDSPFASELRFAYFASCAAVYRPFILAAFQDEAVVDNTNSNVAAYCKKCLEACVRQIEYAPSIGTPNLPSRWKAANYIAAELLLVMGASLVPGLAAMLPPEDDMGNMIQQAIQQLDRQASSSPSLRNKVEMLKEAEHKRQRIQQRRQP